MNKKNMGPQTMLFPKPVVLAVAHVNDTPDFTTVAFAGIVCNDPPMIAIGLQHSRHILKGIRQNMTFSVNIPSSELATGTDYCGITSGARTDKVKDCRFKVHQDIRVAVVGPATESTTLFSLVRKPITPPAVQTTLQHTAVLTAQWL